MNEEGLSSADYAAGIPQVECDEVSLVVTDPNIEKSEWAEILRRVSPERENSWWLGDLLAFGERSYGDGTYQLAADALGYSNVGSLRNLASVSRRVVPEARRVDLPWRTHRVVAKLNPVEQTFWLERAAEEGWTSDDLRRQLAAQQFPTGKNANVDPAKHWEAAGLPDYGQREKSFRVVVSCETEEERDDFLASIGDPIVHNTSGRTLSVWYPDRPKDDVASLEFA